MRVASVLVDGVVRVGVVEGDGVHLLDRPVTVLDLLRSGDLTAAGRDALRSRPVALGDVRLLAPLEPPTVRDFVAFEEHVEGVRKAIDGVGGVVPEWYEAPTFYFTNPYAVIGPDDDVPVPPGSSVLDFELEVAAVIGREGRHLAPERAREHIAGYTIFNDWSARDLQAREMKVSLGPAKGKDTATTLGPWLVTADELEPYRDADGFLAARHDRRGQRPRRRPRPALEHGLAVRGPRSPTRPAAPSCAPATSWARAPAATAAASPSSGAAAPRARSSRPCAPATSSP